MWSLRVFQCFICNDSVVCTALYAKQGAAGGTHVEFLVTHPVADAHAGHFSVAILEKVDGLCVVRYDGPMLGRRQRDLLDPQSL